jgi:NAD(P)-dependent dehydrogenase (short-subunit alcohol dehydrogenase family)
MNIREWEASMRLNGKVALVAGGGMGIGRACALLFAVQGARVVVGDIDEAAGKNTAQEIQAAGGQACSMAADMAEWAPVQRLVDTTLDLYGRVDILLSSVGIYARGRLTDLDEQVWDRLMRVNVKSAFLLCKAVIPPMQPAGGGSIILTSSSVGWGGAAPNIAAYAASKFAITGLTKALACEVLGEGIRVNCLCPGPTDTPMIRGGRTPQELEALVERLPGRRLADPLEIAQAALFLASDDSRFATGVALPIDGGQTAWV